MSLAPKNDFLLLIDASSYIHRAFHALPRTVRQSDGLPTGALAGFCNSLLKLTRLNWTAINRLPRYAAIVCDYRGRNFRHDLHPEYKANRKSYDEALLQQLPWIEPIARAFALPVIMVPGYEADDVIATYCEAATWEGIDVVVAASDKDMYQLVTVEDDYRIILYDAMRDKREDERSPLIGPDEVYSKFGVYPRKMVDVQALIGDSVDNVPGVPKIGPKTAARLINQFNDVFTLIDEADWGNEDIPKKDIARIIEHKDQILLSRKLVTLNREVPVPFDIAQLELEIAPSFELRSLLMDLEFVHLVDRVDRPVREF